MNAVLPRFRSLSPVLGVEVHGVNLREAIHEDVKQALREAWHRHALLLFRDAGLSDEDLDRIAQMFGVVCYDHVDDRGPLKYVSNVRPDGLVPDGEILFHMDHSFSHSPLRGIMLYAYETPPQGAGGETLFSN